MAISIWKDKFVDLGSSSPQDYTIKDGDNNVLYTGKAYLRPGESTIKVRINDVCADYFAMSLPAMSGANFTPQTFVKTFKTYKANTLVDTSEFLFDWSYDYQYNPNVSGISAPIIRVIDKNQPIVFSTLATSAIPVTYTTSGGTTFNSTIQIARGAAFSGSYNEDFAITASVSASGTAVLTINPLADIVAVSIGNILYKIEPACHKYALYYVNAFGGWDSLLIEGNDAKVDAYTRSSMQMDESNILIENREKRNYLNQITRAITLHTGYLTDDEASRMHHLLGSNMVYLRDLPTGTMMPVLMNAQNCEYKTYTNQGGRMFIYSIEVEVAKEMHRK